MGCLLPETTLFIVYAMQYNFVNFEREYSIVNFIRSQIGAESAS